MLVDNFFKGKTFNELLRNEAESVTSTDSMSLRSQHTDSVTHSFFNESFAGYVSKPMQSDKIFMSYDEFVGRCQVATQMHRKMDNVRIKS